MNSLRKVYEQQLDRLLDLTCFSGSMMAVYIAYKGLSGRRTGVLAGVTQQVTSSEDDLANAQPYTPEPYPDHQKNAHPVGIFVRGRLA